MFTDRTDDKLTLTHLIYQIKQTNAMQAVDVNSSSHGSGSE